MVNPCKNCSNRKMVGNRTCHSFCKKYKSWKQNLIAERDRIHDKNVIDYWSYSNYDAKSIKKHQFKVQYEKR